MQWSLVWQRGAGWEGLAVGGVQLQVELVGVGFRWVLWHATGLVLSGSAGAFVVWLACKQTNEHDMKTCRQTQTESTHTPHAHTHAHPYTLAHTFICTHTKCSLPFAADFDCGNKLNSMQMYACHTHVPTSLYLTLPLPYSPPLPLCVCVYQPLQRTPNLIIFHNR